MPDIISMTKAIKIKCISRLMSGNNACSHVAGQMSKLEDFKTFFSYNLNSRHLKSRATAFYKQIIDFV